MWTGANMARGLVRRFVVEESGQDLIEYALMGAALGLSGLATFGFIVTHMAASYTTWDSGVQNLWQLPAPSGS